MVIGILEVNWLLYADIQNKSLCRKSNLRRMNVFSQDLIVIKMNTCI